MTPFQGKLRIRHLEIVLTVSECGSLSKAAAQLRMTQSGLSRAITEIEELAGGRLFERTGKGTACTPLGTAMCRHARILMGDFAKAATELAAVSSGEAGSVTIGCFSMFSGWPLAEAVRRFRAEFPRVSLTIRIGMHETLMEDLDAAQLDVLISRQLASLDPGIYRWLPLLTDSVVLAGAAEHPLARRQAVNLADCAAYPWVTAPARTRLRTELETRLHDSGCPVPDIVGALSLEFATEMLADARHLCMLPGSVAAVLQRRGVLQVLPVALGLQGSPLAAIWRRERSSTRPVRAFAATLAEVIRAEPALRDS